ncbi:MAG: hypothetical protein ABFR97_08235 [Thermodesulfobacteriota bacterium]
MKKICLESAKRKYTQQRHEGTYHSLWFRENWQAQWQRYTSSEGEDRFSFKELPRHRRKLAVASANSDNHQISDVPEGQQKLNLLAERERKQEASRKTVIRKRRVS